MDNPRTRRPPGRPAHTVRPAQRRTMRGRRNVPGMIRPHLAETVSVLKEAGRYDLATTMEELGKPRGYLLLQRTDDTSPSPISLTVPKALKMELQETAEEMDKVLDSLADDAYRLVLAGEWVPPKWQKSPARKGGAGQLATLQVQVDRELREQVQQKLPELSETAGYRVTESSIVMTYLCDELGVDRGLSAAMVLLLPAPLRDHFAAARDGGVDLSAVVDERVRQLMDGSWELPRPSRVVKGTWAGGKYAKLGGVILKTDVRDALHDLAPVLSEKLGMRVYPGMIVRAILTDRLGEPAE